MSNEYFTSSSVPANGAPGMAATIRQEFAQIEASFNKLPVLAGKAGEIVRVNPTGTSLESSGKVISDFVTLAEFGTLTNKTLNWADNTISTIPIEGGGTGATTLADAQEALGINLKADAVNAVLSGTPVAETAPPGTATTRLATTQFVTNALALLAFEAGSVAPSDAIPLGDTGSGLAGTALSVSRADHRHPVDTSLMPITGGTFSDTVSGPTQADADNSTKLATTAWVRTRIAATAIPESQVTNLVADLAAKAPLNSPTFTGTPLLTTTPTAGDNTTKIASTAFVTTAVATATAGSVGVTTSVTPLMDNTAAIGTSPDAARADHVHPKDTSKQNVITGAATTIDTEDLAINRALVSSGTGKVAVSTVTATELGYLDGVTSAIQTQLTNKQPLDTDLTTIAALTHADGKFIVSNGTSWVGESGAVARASLSIITATASAEGLVELATVAEVAAGDTTRAATGAGVVAAINGAFRDMNVYTADATWTKPAGLKRIRVTVIGGGGSGGASTGNLPAGGGGGGGCAIEVIEAASITTATCDVVVGAGGVATTTAGAAGGTSSFSLAGGAAFCSATGGAAGTTNSGTAGSDGGTGGANGGIGSGGGLNIAGSPGDSSVVGSVGAATGAGGSSYFGGGAANGVTAGTGSAGRSYGGGGEGGWASSADTAGGNGADGIVIVEEFY